MTELGLKKLTVSNWLEPDTASTAWVILSPHGSAKPMTGDEWVECFLKPELAKTVPEDIRRLFAVARGAMVYGFLFYPLYTLGTEQLFRVAETAVAFKCKAMGATRPKRSLDDKIKWLIDRSAIPKSEAVRWDALRVLRNISSHPEAQAIHMPSDALRFLEHVAGSINSLFART